MTKTTREKMKGYFRSLKRFATDTAIVVLSAKNVTDQLIKMEKLKRMVNELTNAMNGTSVRADQDEDQINVIRKVFTVKREGGHPNSLR